MGISIGGISSGLDTAQIITDLMKLEREPYNRMATRKTNLSSEQAIFRTLNTKLNTLKTAVSDLLLNSTYSLVSATSSDESVVKVTADEGASTGNFNINVTQTAKSHMVKSGVVNTSATNLVGKTFSILKADGSSIDIDTTDQATNGDALEYIKNQINQNNAGITAAVVTVSDTEKVLVLTSQKTGTDYKMVMGSPASGTNNVGIDGDALAVLGITDITNTGSNTYQKADDAILSINGVSITRSSNQITDAISGATINILKSGNSTVAVNTDGDKVAKKIQAFVDAYNDVVSLVTDNLKKPSDKTKMNPLQGDSVLKEVSDRLYTILNGLVNTSAGKGMLAQVGLTIDKGVTKADLLTKKIAFDQDLFKEKLATDPNFVKDLFKADDTSAANFDGVARILNEQLQEWTSSTSGLLTSKIAGYDAEVKMIDDRMTAMDLRLTMKEEQLKKQFTAMEVALSKLKNEQNWLAGQFAALTNSKKSS